MNISLGSDAQKIIEERIKRGGYATPEDVVLAGLDALEREEAFGAFGPGELDALLTEGEQSGEALNGEQVLTELRELRSRHTGRPA